MSFIDGDVSLRVIPSAIADDGLSLVFYFRAAAKFSSSVLKLNAVASKTTWAHQLANGVTTSATEITRSSRAEELLLHQNWNDP